MKTLIILFAYLAGLTSLLPSLAVAAITAAVAWVGVRFVVQIIQILLS